MENLDGYQQKLSDLKQESRHFNQEFVEILDNKTGDIATALEPVKTSLEEIIKYDFSSNLSGLKEQIDQIYANVNTQMQMTLGQNQVLTDSLEKIYNDAVDKINDVNNAISSQVQNNLEVLKSAVEEINNGVKDSFDNNNQLMTEWKSLLVLIDGKITDLSANCTNMLSSVAVDVTNAVNSKIETLLEDLKGYIGVPVNANDLMWSVDNLKTELTNKFTELEEKQSSNLNAEQASWMAAYGYPAYTQVKFAPYNDVVGQSVNANHIPLMRIEEMYLIKAEGEAMSGNTGAAKTTLEGFVKSYRDPEYTCSAASATDIQEEIYRQRRIEFWGEGMIWFDIMRLNKSVDRRGAGFPNETSVFNIAAGSDILLWRIPENEINANPALSESDNNPSAPLPTPIPDEE